MIMTHTIHGPHPQVHRADRMRIGEVLLGAFVGISAVGGAIGLMFGAIDLGPTVVSRVPFDSPVLAGTALALIVALPALAAAWFAAHDDERTEAAQVVAGVAVMGWIVVQFAIIREFSFLQPTFFVVGAAMAVLGQRASH
jgi:hypothetical protein